MLEKIKYNFWLLVFVAITLCFLFFLYQAISFTSVYAYRWLFFTSVPFLTSGIHLLIKSRSNTAEIISILNFGLIAALIAYFNADTERIYTIWSWFIIPVFNQVYINLFDVVWSNPYKFKKITVGLFTALWVLTLFCLITHFKWLSTWFVPSLCFIGLFGLLTLFFESKIPADPDQ